MFLYVWLPDYYIGQPNIKLMLYSYVPEDDEDDEDDEDEDESWQEIPTEAWFSYI